jgi:hypothetical protein
MRSNFIAISIAVFLAWMAPLSAMSAEPATEIEYLLHAIGQSECIFTRNGNDHSAPEAENHLRMKYDRTKSRIKTAEAFIDHLASKSSWTGKPYTIHCTNGDPEPSGQWLYRELTQYRQS